MIDTDEVHLKIIVYYWQTTNNYIATTYNRINYWVKIMSLLMQVKRTVEVVKSFPGLGEKIKKAREGDKRSLSKICRESGISRPYWYQLENEQIYSSVSEEMIRRIEATLGVDLGVIFED
ncbi:MAG: helix-turn-helix domain-containing protein [Nostoc sp.]